MIIPFFPIFSNDLLFEFDLLGFTWGIGLQIGLITAASKIVQFFLAPAMGDLSDNVGRKPLILIGMSLYTILMIGYGFASDFSSLFLLRAFQGIGSASVWSIGEALVVDLSEPEKQGKNLGFYMFSMLAGLTLGPFLGYGFFEVFNSWFGLNEMLSYRYTFIAVGSFGLLATIMVIFLVKDPKAKEYTSVRKLYVSSIKAMIKKIIQSPLILLRSLSSDNGYRNKSIYTLYIVALVNGLGLSLLLPISALFLEDFYLLDPGDIALIIGVIGVFSLFGAPAGGWISDNLGKKITVWSTGILGGILMLVMGFQMPLLVLIFLFTLRRFFFSILSPSFRSLQSVLTPEAVRGKEFGVVQAANNLGSSFGPILGGYLYDIFLSSNFVVGSFLFFGGGVPFAVSGLLAILAMVFVLLFIKEKPVIDP